MVLYISFPKLTEGNIADSFNPRFIIENRYPGTMRINKKNAITPKIVIYLLSDTNPIGTIAAKINQIKRIGNLLMFLHGYFNELDTIFPISITPPQIPFLQKSIFCDLFK